MVGAFKRRPSRGAGAAATGFEPLARSPARRRSQTRTVSAPHVQPPSPGGPPGSPGRPGSPGSPGHSGPPWPWWRRRVPLGALLWLAAAALALARLAMLAAPLHWTLELSTHFAFQYALAALVLLLAFGMRRRRFGLVAGLLLVGVHGAPLVEVARAELGGSAEAATRREGDLRFLLANVRTSNPQRRPLMELVRAVEPDVVLLLEVSQGWLDDLAPLESAYPHRLTVPRGDNFGIAILSARPLVDGRVLDLGATGVPSLEAGFKGSSLRLLLTHPVPPMGAASAARRDGQLERAGEWAAEWAARGAEASGGRAVLAGDLNATPWSPIFRRVLDRGRLRDSREGFGLQRTWPSGLHALLRLPIDHVLVGEGVTVLRREVGPHIGSDHRPVIVDLR